MLPAILLVPAVALLLSGRQQKVYAADAQVLVSYTNVAASLNGLGAPNVVQTPDRILTTQAALARDPAVAQAALSLSRVASTPSDFLRRSSVSTVTNADLLDFSVRDPRPALATRLATTYAQAYIIYRGQLDSHTIDAALADVNLRLGQLSRAGQTGPTYKALSHEQQVLTATQAAGTNAAQLVQPAADAVQVAPRPTRSGAIGLGLGIALALVLAFLMEALDTRVGSVEEIERRLGLPLLARLPAPGRWRPGTVSLPPLRGFVEEIEGRLGRAPLPRPARGRPGTGSLATLRDPTGRQAEAFRVLKSSLDFASLEHDPKSILFTCGHEYEGRSTTIANLAVTLVQSGWRVLLCDLNVRRPAIGELFGLDGRPGVTDVALGRVRLDEAITSITARSLGSPALTEAADATTNGLRSMQGALEILPFGGGSPPNAGFLGSRAVAGLVEELKHTGADYLLIDAPALLSHRDALTLSARVDAVILALAAPVRRPMLDQLARTLSTSPARPLGFITVGAFPDRGYGAGATSYDLGQASASSNGRNGHASMPQSLTPG